MKGEVHGSNISALEALDKEMSDRTIYHDINHRSPNLKIFNDSPTSDVARISPALLAFTPAFTPLPEHRYSLQGPQHVNSDPD